MTTLILNWHQACEAELLTCGGKGYHCANLHRYGFPVPDGGIVVADVYRQPMQAPALAELKQALAPLRTEDATDPMGQEQLAHLQQSMTAAALPARHLLLEVGRRLVAGGHMERPEQAFHLSKADLWPVLSYWTRDHWLLP
jgi:hypothetical protein